MDTESRIYNYIYSEHEKPPMFVLVNPYEIDILEDIRATIKHIKYHAFDKWQDKQTWYKALDHYRDLEYDGEIYLLGKGPIYTHCVEKLPKGTNIRWEPNFNCLKYLSQFNGEIEVAEAVSDATQTNREFVETLRREYKKSLFFCPYNTGIIGIEGYLPFYNGFYRYLDTVESIYIVNCDERSSRTYKNTISEFFTHLETHHSAKLKYIQVYEAELYRTNPELIAFYRVNMDERYYNYAETHFGFEYRSTHIDDRIIIGSDSYKERSCRSTDTTKWFPEDEITHILNVSNEPVSNYYLGKNAHKYEYYPIIEGDEDKEKTRTTLFKAAERLHEILEENPTNLIFIHCAIGVNRSPAAVLLYFIKYRGMTLYEAYKTLATKRRIFTNLDLFEILYKEAAFTSGDQISPLKLKTNHAGNFNEPTAYMFAFYDMLRLEEIFE